MTTYRVSWEIDIEAESPEEAAKQAREIQLDPQSTATNFSVHQRGTKQVTIDLLLEIGTD